MDLAASVQVVAEEVMLNMTRALSKETGLKSLCLASGVALNCLANGKVLRDGAFENVWVQPAAGAAGGGLGAARAAYHQHLEHPRKGGNGDDAMQGSYLGPDYKQVVIEQRLEAAGAKFEVLDEWDMIDTTARAQAVADGKAIGWFQGRMEFGPGRWGGGRFWVIRARRRCRNF